ncbi:MAG TPA: hypothetical protein VLY24_03145 [Bryobacteraceae bacterium]|nr:hypothetical protein [Bryobacteraceae bacterium]
MTRRRLVLAMMAAPLVWADEAQDVRDFFGQLGSALSEGDAGQFMKNFDRSMPGYEMLATNVEALVLQQDVQSSIEILSAEGTDTKRMLELDWFLQFVEPGPGGDTTRRREQVKCTLARQGKRWLITSLEPLSLFAPPAAK